MSETRARVKNHPTQERRDAAGREKPRTPFSSFSRGLILKRACVSLAPLSLRENEGLLVVYCKLGKSVGELMLV